jgi:hypothetical protein
MADAIPDTIAAGTGTFSFTVSAGTSMIAPFLHTLTHAPQPVHWSISIFAISDIVIAFTGHTSTHNPHPTHNDSFTWYFIFSILLVYFLSVVIAAQVLLPGIRALKVPVALKWLACQSAFPAIEPVAVAFAMFRFLDTVLLVAAHPDFVQPSPVNIQVASIRGVLSHSTYFYFRLSFHSPPIF